MTHQKCRCLLLVVVAAAAIEVVSLPPVAGQPPRSRAKVAARQDAERQPVKPGEIDLEKSRVYVFVEKTGLGHEHAIEGKVKSGTVHLGARHDAGEIEFDMSSFSADTDRARKYIGLKGSTSASTRQQVDRNMLGADVLDVRRHPTALFAIDSAIAAKSEQGHTIYELKGKFTLHGRTRSLTIHARTSEKDGQRELRGDFTVLQTDYGITPYTAALGTIGVADRLKIWGDISIAGEDMPQQ